MSSGGRTPGPYVLGLDLGTSAIHCLLTGEHGTPVCATSAQVTYFRPPDGSQLAREFDPSQVMGSVHVAMGRALRDSGIAGSQVSAIGITSQRQGLVCLDRQGQEVYCSPNLDVRGVFEGAAIDEEFGPRIYGTTGHFPSILLAPARLRWLKSNRPEGYQRLDRVLSVSGWLAYRLTGAAVAEISLECEAGLADVSKKRRCPGLMDDLQVPSCLLPPVTHPGAAAGWLTTEHADAQGIKSGTPVFLAGADTQCGLVGMGVTEPGGTAAVLGWSGAVQSLTAEPRFHDAMRTWVGCLAMDGAWVVESNLGDAGNAYRWLKDTILGTSAGFSEAEALAREASAAEEGVMALLGPGPDASVRAGLKRGGILFPTPLSFQEASRGQIFKAALENVAFSVKANLEAIGEVADAGTGPLHLGGGMASSDTLAACLATTLDRPVLRPAAPQVSARGAAMLASHWSGGTGLDEAKRSVSQELRRIEPGSPSEVARYDEHYREWLDLSRRLEWVRD